MMIAYGPADDAQIAIGIVVEYGGGGARAGDLMVDIFNAYFAMKDGTLEVDPLWQPAHRGTGGRRSIRYRRPDRPAMRQRMHRPIQAPRNRSRRPHPQG